VLETTPCRSYRGMGMAGYNSHTQVALKVLNRKVLSSPLLSFVTFHLPPPCVVRAVALRPSCSSSSPAEYSKRTAELDCEDDDMALTTGLDTSLGLARRKRNIVVCGLIGRCRRVDERALYKILARDPLFPYSYLATWLDRLLETF